MAWTDLLQVFFELLWPIILLFSLALLVKSVIRRKRAKRQLRFRRETLLFYTSAIASIFGVIFTSVVGINPLIDSCVTSGRLDAQNGFLLFWSLLMLSLLMIALLVTRFLCVVWPVDHVKDQGNKV